VSLEEKRGDSLDKKGVVSEKENRRYWRRSFEELIFFSKYKTHLNWGTKKFIGGEFWRG